MTLKNKNKIKSNRKSPTQANEWGTLRFLSFLKFSHKSAAIGIAVMQALVRILSVTGTIGDFLFWRTPMELMQAIATHTRFNRMLASYVARPDRSLEASMVGAAERCDLGRWISGEGNRYADMPEFSALVTSHAHYHRAAADIVKRADAGQAEVAEIGLGSSSEFAYASAGVVRALMFLHGKLAKGRAAAQ